MKKHQRVLWRFQCKKGDFWFVIPDNRADWGGDFFVHKKHFLWASDGQRVAAEIIDRVSGKKPEVKIVEVFSGKQIENKKYDVIKVVEWIFSGGNGDFAFVDVEGREDGYFCYGLKKNGAKDGDRVRANIKKYNGKEEAIVIDILKGKNEIIEGIFSDNEKFGFVKPFNKTDDIFIAGSRKWEAKNGDKVEVKIIKKWWRRAEGIVLRVL